MMQQQQNPEAGEEIDDLELDFGDFGEEMAQGDMSMLDQSMSQLTMMMDPGHSGPQQMTYEQIGNHILSSVKKHFFLEEVRPKYAKFTTMRAFGSSNAELQLAIKKAGLDWDVFCQLI